MPTHRTLLGLLAVALLIPGSALAQAWPAHPIVFIMGFPAGSGVDVVARMLQEPMEKSLGGRIVTDYRVGAGAVPRHGEIRPRQVGGGGQAGRRDDRLTK